MRRTVRTVGGRTLGPHDERQGAVVGSRLRARERARAKHQDQARRGGRPVVARLVGGGARLARQRDVGRQLDARALAGRAAPLHFVRHRDQARREFERPRGTRSGRRDRVAVGAGVRVEADALASHRVHAEIGEGPEGHVVEAGDPHLVARGGGGRRAGQSRHEGERHRGRQTRRCAPPQAAPALSSHQSGGRRSDRHHAHAVTLARPPGSACPCRPWRPPWSAGWRSRS
jgi:hypothetical protein